MKLILLFLLTLSGLSGSIGNVASMIGDAKIVRAGGDVSLAISTPIEEKDLIVTQGRTRVQILLNDDTVITIGPNSEFGFDKFNNSATPEVKMSAKKGFFRAMSGKIGKIAPNRFKIKTRSATIGIRGTHFMGQIGADSEKIACIRGAITMTTALKMYELPSGQMITLAQGSWKQENLDMKKFKNAKVEGAVSEESKKSSNSANREVAVSEESDMQEGFFSDQIQREEIDKFRDLVDVDKIEPEILPEVIELPTQPVGFTPGASIEDTRPENDISNTGTMN